MYITCLCVLSLFPFVCVYVCFFFSLFYVWHRADVLGSVCMFCVHVYACSYLSPLIYLSTYTCVYVFFLMYVVYFSVFFVCVLMSVCLSSFCMCSFCVSFLFLFTVYPFLIHRCFFNNNACLFIFLVYFAFVFSISLCMFTSTCFLSLFVCVCFEGWVVWGVISRLTFYRHFLLTCECVCLRV